MLKPALIKYFDEYAASHQHPTNRLTHKLAIPVIVFHIIAMLTWVSLGTVAGRHVTLGHVVYVAAVAWYVRLDVKLGAIMALLVGLCFPLAHFTPRIVVVGLAIGAWLVQLAGHVVWEKKQPAFFTNLFQALIGPVFFVATLTGDWPASKRAQA